MKEGSQVTLDAYSDAPVVNGGSGREVAGSSGEKLVITSPTPESPPNFEESSIDPNSPVGRGNYTADTDAPED